MLLRLLGQVYSSPQLTARIFVFLCCALPLAAPAEERLVARNPDGWFTLEVPVSLATVVRHADADGGVFGAEVENPTIVISWTYWSYAQAPNFARDRHGVAYKRAEDVYPPQSALTRAVIDGHLAEVDQYRIPESDLRHNQGLQYRYSISMSALPVDDASQSETEPPVISGHRARGIFILTVDYRDPRDVAVAKRIASSLRFTH
jgi:hypothetical protein